MYFKKLEQSFIEQEVSTTKIIFTVLMYFYDKLCIAKLQKYDFEIFIKYQQSSED